MRTATASSSAGVSGCSSPVSRWRNSGIGTPQVRWREMHQSGRPATMPSMRSSPHVGDPLHARDGREARFAQVVLVEADEPLGRGAEDQRRLVPPAMGVAVLELLSVQQAPVLAQQLHDAAVALVDVHAREQGRAGHVHATSVHGIVHRELVAEAGLVVVLAMGRRRVHGARAGIEGDVVGKDDGHFAGEERMMQHQPLEQRTLETGQRHGVQGAVAAQCRLGKPLGQHEQDDSRRQLRLDQHVGQPGAQGHRLVGRQRPGRRGPDRHRHRSACADFEPPVQLPGIDDFETRIEGGRGLVQVFHFGLGQRRPAVEAPVHGLVAPQQVAVLDDAGEAADLLGLEAGVQREVRTVPVAQHAEATEVPALAVHLLQGVLPAGLAELGGGQLLADLAQLLLDLRARWAGRGNPSPGCRARRSRPGSST